jgi:hypothetical protein
MQLLKILRPRQQKAKISGDLKIKRQLKVRRRFLKNAKGMNKLQILVRYLNLWLKLLTAAEKLIRLTMYRI